STFDARAAGERSGNMPNLGGDVVAANVCTPTLRRIERLLIDADTNHVSGCGAENADDGAAEHHCGVNRGARDEQAQPAANLEKPDGDAQGLPEPGDIKGLDHDVGTEQLGAAGADVDQAEESLKPVEPGDRH